jgi:co-chaperonin GroES (HSP10)
MKIQPIGEKVAVKVIKEDEVTLGGLVTVVQKGNSNKGLIVALGEEVTEYLHEGDTVIFNRGSGVSYTDGTDDYLVLNVRDILGKVIE